MIPSMDMEMTSDEKALTLTAMREHTCPDSLQITCDRTAHVFTVELRRQNRGVVDRSEYPRV